MATTPGGTAALRLLPDILRERAAHQPDDTALVVDGVGSVSYAELDERSNAFGRGLASRGVQSGDRVALSFGPDEWIDYVVAFFGTHKAGAVAVPLSSALVGAQLATACETVGAIGICLGRLRPPDVSAHRWQVPELEESNDRDAFQVAVAPTSLAQILYTSGTTGTAKAVAASHEELLYGIQSGGWPVETELRFKTGLHALPIGVNASQGFLVRAMHRFARCVILPRFDPERFGGLIEEHRVRFTMLVPPMALALVDWNVSSRHDLSLVRAVVLTGAPTPPALFPRLAEAFPGAAILNCYALTETGGVGTSMHYDPSRPNSVGRPRAGDGVRILDDRGAERGAGETGEVWLARRGAPQRFYFGDPKASAEVFQEGWTRTGDLGYVDEEGYLYLTDRKNQAVISGGRNVSSIEVEGVLHEHPAVAEAAVFGLPHPTLGEDVAAAVVLRSPLTARHLRDFARERLAEYQVPHRLLFLDRLPRNDMGKVVKAELRERALAEPSRGVATARTPMEAMLLSVCHQLLGHEDVGVDDRFVDLGIDSLSTLNLIVRLEEEVGVRLRPEAVYETETVAALASCIEEIVALQHAPLAHLPGAL